MNKIKKFGEIFTPKNLVNEMIDILPPESYTLGKKILDPASGKNAIFPIELFKRVVKNNISTHTYDTIVNIFCKMIIQGLKIRIKRK